MYAALCHLGLEEVFNWKRALENAEAEEFKDVRIMGTVVFLELHTKD